MKTFDTIVITAANESQKNTVLTLKIADETNLFASVAGSSFSGISLS